jgi:hypothetical protein
MRLDQLPRDDNGIVIGAWLLRHRVPGYTVDHGAPLSFVDGVTVAPLFGRALERAMSGLGDEVEAEQAPETSAPAAESSATTSSHATSPSTLAELDALTEEELRTLAIEKGADGRWKVGRLRRYLARELEIEGADGL